MEYTALPSKLLQLFTTKYTMALPDRAKEVLDVFAGKGLGERPILFICHSLGGLLIKQILRSSADEINERKRAIFEQTRAVLFLATPHQGSQLATLLHRLWFLRPTAIMEALRLGDAHLGDLLDWYRHHSERTGIHTRTYRETRPFRGAIVVQSYSAHPAVGENPIPLEEDHSSIAKPQSPDAPVCLAANDMLRMHVLTEGPGTSKIHLLPHLRQQVETQLAEEKRIARYIPDVFVETQDTKYRARCFAHPALFVHRIADWFDRQPFADLNRLARKSGVPPVSTPAMQTITVANTPEDAAAAAQAVIKDLDRLDVTLDAYRQIVRGGGAAVPRDPARTYVLNETRYYIEMNAGTMRYDVRDRRAELDCVAARFFLLTGPAGQGKTNFLCDFTEKFLLRHGVPCAYVTARQLSRIPNPDLTDVIRRLIFPPAFSSLEEGLTALKTSCNERGQPFVLVIDGLNEHPDVRLFAGQLEYLLETLVRYPHVRVLMTCRSEFLEQRFGTLLAGHLKPFLHLSKAHGQRFGNKQYRELVVRYFRFFRVRSSRVHRSVIDFLQRDILLLRFFCESYGARGRDKAYVQPYVSGIYRDEIFRRYIEHKLDRAQRTMIDDRSAARPLVRKPGFRRVLSLVAAHMLETGQFTDVPRSVVPTDLDAELTALLDEELVLRHDLRPAPSLLAEPTEVLNFTFDEMRDFMLAQHLIGVYALDPGEFDRLVAAQQATTSQSIEGVQRFLFYASRVPENVQFYEHYRVHQWYDAVYDTEVFAVPPTHLNSEDRRVVEAALAVGGKRAQHFAKELAYRWQSSVFPTLNLDLLLDVARYADGSFFTEVVVPTFGRVYYDEVSLGDVFCRFANEKIFPKFEPNQEHPYDSIFRLLLLLLPVDANPTLDSPAMATFGRLISGHPDYALALLRESLEEGKRSHRPFLWRLLEATRSSINDPNYFIATAQADLADPISDAILHREATRFITRVVEGDNSV